MFPASRNLQGFALCAQGPSKFIHFVFSLWCHLLRILLIKTLLFKVTCDFRSGPFVAHQNLGHQMLHPTCVHKDLYKKGVRRPFLSISCAYALDIFSDEFGGVSTTSTKTRRASIRCALSCPKLCKNMDRVCKIGIQELAVAGLFLRIHN